MTANDLYIAIPTRPDANDPDAPVKVNVYTGNTLSNSGFHRAGKPNWWLQRDATKGFVRIPQIRGDQRVDLDLELTPGAYTLGTGPTRGKDSRRIHIQVTAPTVEGKDWDALDAIAKAAKALAEVPADSIASSGIATAVSALVAAAHEAGLES